MARKFFLVAAGMFLLALSYHLGASTAGANGGAANAGLASPTEVAVLDGVLRTANLIPLPTYADGTTALESECRWTVSPSFTASSGPVWCYTADAFYNVPKPSAAPAGRVLNCGPSATVDNESTANYLIIATRGASSPTTALHQSWGQVKARYQNTPGTTVTPGANDR